MRWNRCWPHGCPPPGCGSCSSPLASFRWRCRRASAACLHGTSRRSFPGHCHAVEQAISVGGTPPPESALVSRPGGCSGGGIHPAGVEASMSGRRVEAPCPKRSGPLQPPRAPAPTPPRWGALPLQADDRLGISKATCTTGWCIATLIELPEPSGCANELRGDRPTSGRDSPLAQQTPAGERTRWRGASRLRRRQG